MYALTKTAFDSVAYLTSASWSRKIVHYKAKNAFFSQGSQADCIFYVHVGRAGHTVISNSGQKAPVTLLSASDFVGEKSITGAYGLHRAMAAAITACITLKIDKAEMLRVLRVEHVFFDFFLRVMLVRGLRTPVDLVDQLFNSSERRLARTLLLMDKCRASGEPKALISSIIHETLAHMIGAVRSRIRFFMNRFRELDYINYKGRIRVYRSLLNAVLPSKTAQIEAAHASVLQACNVLMRLICLQALASRAQLLSEYGIQYD